MSDLNEKLRQSIEAENLKRSVGEINGCSMPQTQPMGMVGREIQRPSLADQAAANANLYLNEHIRAQQAEAFFRANPAFDEFIRLVRAGVVQI